MKIILLSLMILGLGSITCMITSNLVYEQRQVISQGLSHTEVIE